MMPFDYWLWWGFDILFTIAGPILYLTGSEWPILAISVGYFILSRVISYKAEGHILAQPSGTPPWIGET